MKVLILVRHAKSSWKDQSLTDHDRPLGKRGMRDAPFMAEILSKKKIAVDLVVSSTAKRALGTAKEFAKKLDYNKKDILHASEIYEADLNDLVEYVKELNDEKKTVMMFGHNPGFTSLTDFLSYSNIDNIPTCGIVAIEFDFIHWNEITKDSGRMIFFEYPKLYFKDAEDQRC